MLGDEDQTETDNEPSIYMGPSIGQIHVMGRERLANRHLELMEKIRKENAHKSKYWILGMVKVKRKNRRTTIRPFLVACDEMPEVRKESYLYEVDNTSGTLTLLWVMHPHDVLNIPTLNKSIRVAGDRALT